MAMRKPMTDSSNHPKHHSNLSKKISKKASRNHISTGINTHEEEKMEIQVEESQRDKEMPMKNGNAGVIDSDSENAEENLDLNVEDVKKNKLVLEKNQDKIAEISHYLILKNKINAKNAFDIPMLNVKEMTAFNKIEAEFAWKNLSSALEAGAKIYGFRVDSVHSETYKILGGLNRTELEENKEKEGEGNQQNFGNQNELRAEDLIRKKPESSDSNTLEKNMNNINTQKYDLEFDVDPLFSKTSAKFDEAGSKGLLLNNTCINQNLELLFDIQNPRKIAKSEEKPINVEITKKYNSVEDVVMENISKHIFEMKLCPEIVAFKDEINNEASMFKPSKYFPSADKSMAMIGEQKPNEIEMAFKDMNFFTESLDENYLNDMDFPDMGQENQAAEENDENYGNANEFGNEMYEESNMNLNGQNNVTNLASTEAGLSKSDDMHSVDHKFNLNSIQEKNCNIGNGKTFTNFVDVGVTKWMGPEQWKINKLNLTKGKEVPKDSEQPQHKERSKKIVKGAIDFDMSVKERLHDIFGTNSKKGHANNALAGKSQDLAPIKHAFLLPMDYHIDINRLGRTYLRDPALNMNLVKIDQEEHEGGTQSQFNNQFQERPDNEEIINEDEVVVLEADEKTGKSKRVTHKGQIPIKELKEKIWNKMVALKKFESNIQEEDEGMINEEEKELSAQPNKCGYRFGSIVEMLPDIVGESNSRKVSVQTCFVTMLHLANEKILKFSQKKEEGNDFFIERERVRGV